MTRLIFWLSGWCLLICILGREIIFFSGTTCGHTHTCKVSSFFHSSYQCTFLMNGIRSHTLTKIHRFPFPSTAIHQTISYSSVFQHGCTKNRNICPYIKIMCYSKLWVNFGWFGYYRNRTENYWLLQKRNRTKKIIGRHDRRRRVTGARQSCPKRAIMTTLPRDASSSFF